MQLEKIFKLQQKGTNVRTEVIAGATTFATMAYILAVNPNILSVTGMDRNAIFVATALAAAVGSILMGLMANLPFALAPGMGLNVFFAFSVCCGMGYSWQDALLAVAVEGAIFVVLSVTHVRQAIFNAIPEVLKKAISVGIGLFIILIGLINAAIVVKDDSTVVALNDFRTVDPAVRMGMILTIVGLLIIGILHIKKVKGSILIGIVVTWVIGMILQGVGVYVPSPDSGMYSLFPDFSQGTQISSISLTFFKFNFSRILEVRFWIVVISFLFVDMFDTMGTLIGVAMKSDMLDEKGELPRLTWALLADAIATIIGAILGTSTTTTYVESSAGVAEGGKTGLTATTTGILFALALFLSPIFLAIPSFATAPALIMVGVMMIEAILKIDASDYSNWIPAVLCIIGMPFCYSISEGICWGVISYTVFKLFTGKRKEVQPAMIVLTVLFVVKYFII